MPPPPDPVHLQALRDAVGLARVLYAAERDGGAAPERLLAIAEAGRLLVLALGQTRYEPGTLGRKAVPYNAGKAFAALGAMTWPADVAQLVEAARRRTLG